jgi:hypothetical protein
MGNHGGIADHAHAREQFKDTPQVDRRRVFLVQQRDQGLQISRMDLLLLMEEWAVAILAAAG